MTAKSRNIDMCSGPLFKSIWKFVLPFMVTGILQRLYHATDVIVVGRYAGQEALAGVGTTGSLTTLLLNLFLGLSAGVTVTIGHAIGAKKDKAISEIVHTTILTAIICGAFISVVGVIFAEPLLRLTGVPDSVMPYAKTYMQISFCGKIFVLVYNFGVAILRAKGDTKRPLYIISLTGIVNVALNLVFVINFNMASAGVALATIISQFLNALSIIILLVNENDSMRLFINKLKIYPGHIKAIAVVGIPSGIQSTIFSFSNVIIQSSVNSFNSAAAIAGSSAANSVDGFFFVALNSFFQASMAFVSQNMGAKKYERLGKIVVCCLLSVCIVWAVVAFITLFFGKTLLNIYSPGDIEAIKWGIIRLTIVGTTYGLCGFMEVMSGALRGIGYSFFSMFSSIIGVCGIRILWIATVFRAYKSFEVLFVSFPLSWFGTFIFHTVLFIILKRKIENHNKLKGTTV